MTIDGTPVRAQKYEVDGATRYTVWLDGQGVPVMFAVQDDSGTVTFTLARCISCGLDVARLGVAVTVSDSAGAAAPSPASSVKSPRF